MTLRQTQIIEWSTTPDQLRTIANELSLNERLMRGKDG